jgi:hypothetical protein
VDAVEVKIDDGDDRIGAVGDGRWCQAGDAAHARLAELDGVLEAVVLPGVEEPLPVDVDADPRGGAEPAEVLLLLEGEGEVVADPAEAPPLLDVDPSGRARAGGGVEAAEVIRLAGAQVEADSAVGAAARCCRSAGRGAGRSRGASRA